MVLQQVDIPYWNPDLRFSWRRIEPLKVLTSVFCFPMALIPFGNQLHGWKIPKLWQIWFDDFPISGFSIANRLCPLLHGPQSRLVVAMQVRPRAFGYSWQAQGAMVSLKKWWVIDINPLVVSCCLSKLIYISLYLYRLSDDYNGSWQSKTT